MTETLQDKIDKICFCGECATSEQYGIIINKAIQELREDVEYIKRDTSFFLEGSPCTKRVINNLDKVLALVGEKK